MKKHFIVMLTALFVLSLAAVAQAAGLNELTETKV